MDGDSSPLLALPAEILTWISDEVAFEDLANFALTCKGLYTYAKLRLRYQRYYYRRHRLKHDRVPSSTPELLRLILKNWDATFCVRTFDIWCGRMSQDDWRTWPFHDANPTRDDQGAVNPNWPDAYEDFTKQITGFFDAHEQETWSKVMRRLVDMSESDTQASMKLLNEGWDTAMKVLILALLPRIRWVNFVVYRGWQHTMPLQLFCEVILHNHGSGVCPLGFKSLRRVDVATRTPLRAEYEDSGTFSCTPRQVCALFLLPNLKTLNLDGINGDELWSFLTDEEEDVTGPFLDPQDVFSSIEELGLYDCAMSADWLRHFLEAPKGLEKLSIRACPKLPEAGDLLVSSHADNIIELQMPGLQLKHLEKFDNLIHCDCILVDELPVRDLGARKDDDKSESLRKVPDLRAHLPHGIRRLRLSLGGEWTYGPEPLEQLLMMLADLADDTRFASLKEVCIHDLLPTLRREVDVDSRDGMYHKAVSSLLECGVRLHQHFSDTADAVKPHTALHPLLTGQGYIESDPLR